MTFKDFKTEKCATFFDKAFFQQNDMIFIADNSVGVWEDTVGTAILRRDCYATSCHRCCLNTQRCQNCSLGKDKCRVRKTYCWCKKWQNEAIWRNAKCPGNYHPNDPLLFCLSSWDVNILLQCVFNCKAISKAVSCLSNLILWKPYEATFIFGQIVQIFSYESTTDLLSSAWPRTSKATKRHFNIESLWAWHSFLYHICSCLWKPTSSIPHIWRFGDQSVLFTISSFKKNKSNLRQNWSFLAK